MFHKTREHTKFTALKACEVIEIKKVENLQSDNFPEDFALEVKNISQKPIYYFYIAAVLPMTGRGGIPTGFDLLYGNRALISFDKMPEPTDIPIAPGETFILKAENAKNVRQYIENIWGSDYLETALSSVVLAFQVINFGDGTGYIIGDPYPAHKE